MRELPGPTTSSGSISTLSTRPRGLQDPGMEVAVKVGTRVPIGTNVPVGFGDAVGEGDMAGAGVWVGPGIGVTILAVCCVPPV